MNRESLQRGVGKRKLASLHITIFSHPVAELHIMIKIHKGNKYDRHTWRTPRQKSTHKKKKEKKRRYYLTEHITRHHTRPNLFALQHVRGANSRRKKEVGNYLNCRDHIIKYPLFESLTLKFYHMMMVMMMIMMVIVMKSWMPRTRPPFFLYFFFLLP